MTPARCNLKEVSFSHLFPSRTIAYIHSRGYVHGDIYLRDILVNLPSSFRSPFSRAAIRRLWRAGKQVPITQRDGQPLTPNIPAKAVLPLYLGKDAEEFSLSRHSNLTWKFVRGKIAIHRQQDVLQKLGLEPQTSSLSYSANVWSLAVAIWEILGMKAIFSSEYATVDEMIAHQIDVLGPLPLKWFEGWEKRNQYFDNDGYPKDGREETAAILDLMRRMLTFRPEERPTARGVLQSRWMVQWVLPDFERSSQMG
ncbi:hypothetical protein BDV27DRAFT_140346 [Aspergillus caelatus]|uniref:Protein kinase domain-containing protein n=1 Tax=Aspergillus caelatus TaxID=61420 RepID=A0A5N7AKN1_9EURO|nr:uncharacterized protein BDV27DRAFT_140346 [Aspergillus caelatus]KAE8370417.1 hypothetical protein BDV27DRAFT_140346 [Aspergillus caelatus]